MNFALKITGWTARAPGLSEASDWQTWAESTGEIDPAAPQAKLTQLPMMTARRLNSGSRLAVECGLQLLREKQPAAVLFTSRHGELERNCRILHALAHQQPLSPTDFAMSVHNSAVGNLTIAAQQPLVSSSLSAGIDTFQQGLIEAATLLHAGYSRVLLVDFDGTLPDFYHPDLPAGMPTWPWALGLLLEAGDSLSCSTTAAAQPAHEPALPQALQFLGCWLRHQAAFTVPGERLDWHWSRA